MRWINLDRGSIVKHGAFVVRIEHLLSMEEALVSPIEPASAPYHVKVKELSPTGGPDIAELNALPDLQELNPEQRAFLDKWLPIIQALADAPACTRTMVEAAAADAGCCTRTIWKRVQRLREFGVGTAILPARRGRAAKSRNKPALFRVYRSILLRHHGQKERPSVSATISETLTDIKLMGNVPAVPVRTLYRWIKDIDPRELRRRRYSRQEAAQKDTARPRTYDEAQAPLQVIQIDHTLVDLIVVHELLRTSIGRPWLTLAIDVFSRCIVGFYLSLDAPDTTAVALVIAQAIAPKEDLLAKLGVDGTWPVYGPLRKISVDGGSNLNSEAIHMGCRQHGIKHFKREGEAHLGGHIESLIGTTMGKVQLLPGTTFSNVKERGDYDSEKRATYSMRDATAHIAEEIVNGYHQYKHSGIGEPPIRRFERAMLRSSDDHQNRRWRPVDTEQLYMDFLPFDYRPITRRGITWDGLQYWHGMLAPYVDEDRHPKPKYLCRRDPREISPIFVKLGQGQPYIKVPFADSSRPSISLHEHREARAKLREAGGAVDEDRIFRKILRQREIRAQAAAKTKTARRAGARRDWHATNPFSPVAAPVEANDGHASADSLPAEAMRQKRWFQDIG